MMKDKKYTQVLLFIVVAISGLYCFAATTPVEVTEKTLNESFTRVNNVVANCTSVLKDGEAKGLTREEHDQLRNDVEIIRMVLTSFINSQKLPPTENGKKE